MNIASTSPTPTATKTPEQTQKLAQMREAANKVESFFLFQMLQLSQPKMDEDSPFHGGHAEDLFRSKMNEITADNMTQAGGIGVADTIYAQLLKTQEESQ